MECEMPECRSVAKVVYNETNLCKDCYERERAKMDAMLQDGNMID